MSIDDCIRAVNDAFIDAQFEYMPLIAHAFGINDPRYNAAIFDLSKEAALKLLKTLTELRSQAAFLAGSATTIKQKDDITFLLNAIDMNLVSLGIPGQSGYWLELGNNHFSGVMTNLESIFALQPVKTAEDFQNYRTRLSLLPGQFNAMIDNFKSGIRRQATLNKIGIDFIIKFCRNFVGDDLQDFTQAAINSGLNRAEQSKRVTGDEHYLVPVLKDHVLPGVLKVLEFLENVYIHHARATDGIFGLPEGPREYAVNIFVNTELPYTADEVHELGLAEVARIEKLMEESKRKCGYEGTLAEFQRDLMDRTKFPQLYFDDNSVIIPKCEELIQEAKAVMVDFFPAFPKHDCQVKPVPKNLEATAALGQYASGSPTEGGVFTINLRLQNEKPNHQLTSLCLHEGNPGHHHQCSLVMEAESQHMIRRIVMSGPFVEGWGLYSEFLGQEMNMYKTPFDYFGRLEMEMWRALRLVVDSALHGKGWSINQCLELMLTKVAFTRAELLTELYRYTAMPGQALNYKIGELKIKELRAFAEAELRSVFDVKEFHGVVIGEGALPLAMLEKVVKRWVAQKKAGLEVEKKGALVPLLKEPCHIVDLASATQIINSYGKKEGKLEMLLCLITAVLFLVVTQFLLSL
ncbi:hypothetical protein BC830DRAFT_1112911 [Chytriomyces sp. MP71]|nr:hypothetical protein BC830DRAFT_1112911 [Chytriomyces sp. MP71]